VGSADGEVKLDEEEKDDEEEVVEVVSMRVDEEERDFVCRDGTPNASAGVVRTFEGVENVVVGYERFGVLVLVVVGGGGMWVVYRF
jgi:hypothetical protein